MTVDPLSGTMVTLHSGIARGLPCTEEAHRGESEIVYSYHLRPSPGHLCPGGRRAQRRAENGTSRRRCPALEASTKRSSADAGAVQIRAEICLGGYYTGTIGCGDQSAFLLRWHEKDIL